MDNFVDRCCTKMIKRHSLQPTISMVYAMLIIKGATSYGRFNHRLLHNIVDGSLSGGTENVMELSQSNKYVDQVWLCVCCM